MGVPRDITVTMLTVESLSVGDIIDFTHTYFSDQELILSVWVNPPEGRGRWVTLSIVGGDKSLAESYSDHPLSKISERFTQNYSSGVALTFKVRNEIPLTVYSLHFATELDFIGTDVDGFVKNIRGFSVNHFDYCASNVVQPSSVGIYECHDPDDRSYDGSDEYEREAFKLAKVVAEIRQFFYACELVCVGAFQGDETHEDYPEGQNRLYGFPYNSIVLEKKNIPSRLLVELECPRELAKDFVNGERKGVKKPFFLNSWSWDSSFEAQEKNVETFLTKMNDEIEIIEPGFREIEFEDVNFSEEELVEARRAGYRKYWPEIFGESC